MQVSQRALYAGLIPLVIATGPGAVGNHTIGSSALGGMLFGTLFGVIVVPGLYFIFGTLQEGRYLIRDEDQNPLSEDLVESNSPVTSKIKKIFLRFTNKNDNETNN